MKLGGYAHSNGITFFCDVLKVRAVRRKENIEYEVDWILPKGWLKKFDGKFLLGGFVVMYYQWKIMNIKYKLVMSILIAFLLIEEVFHLPPIDPLSLLPVHPYWLYGIGAVVILLNFKKLIRLLQYHGAEHKVINCYTEYGYVNKYLVKRTTRFNKRCGSNLGLILIIVYFVLWRFHIESMLGFFFIYLVAIQISKKIALTDKKWDKYINILQWITVLEPKEEDMELAINSFGHLLRAHDIYRKESSGL